MSNSLCPSNSLSSTSSVAISFIFCFDTVEISSSTAISIHSVSSSGKSARPLAAPPLLPAGLPIETAVAEAVTSGGTLTFSSQ